MISTLNLNTAPIDSAQYARSVREDTAELASYALSDRASVQNASPPVYHRSVQNQLEAHFARGSECDSISNQETDRLSSDVIQEVSESSSPRGEPPLNPWKSPGTSALTDMFRRTARRETSPGTEEYGNWDFEDRTSHSRDRAEGDAGQGFQVIDYNESGVFATERTNLIPKTSSYENHAPRLMQGQQDLEGQETVGITSSWSGMRKIISWPREKGVTIARTLAHPKQWDRGAIWRNAVLAPISYLPAVTLGLLLNILDALSYGRLSHMSTLLASC